MIRNYIITTLRTFRRNPGYMFLNILGLSLGIGCSLVVYSIVSYELSFDKHHENYNQIYRVTRSFQEPNKLYHATNVPHPFGSALREESPSVDEVAMAHYQYGGVVASWDGDKQLKKLSEEENMAFVTPSFFKIFTFPSLSGDLARGVEETNSGVISDRWARKYFDVRGDDWGSVIGKVISINSRLKLTIKGVFQAPPATSDFPFHLLIHYHNIADLSDYYQEGKSWSSMSSATNCFVLVKDKTVKSSLLRTISEVWSQHHSEDEVSRTSFDLQPLSDIHFNADYGNYAGRAVDMDRLWALVAIAAFLIITACINFTNLATAQAVRRSKEIGIRKVMGSHKVQLVFQFYSEALLITLFAGFLALAVAEVFLIQLQDILGYHLSVDLGSHPNAILFLAGVVLLVSLMAGLYPSLVLSRMNPILAIKNNISGRHAGGLSVRRGLVVVQFVISQALIIGTLVVFLQIRYMENQPLGFTKEAIVTTYLSNPNPKDIEELRNKINSISGVADVTFGMGSPIDRNTASGDFSYPDGGVTESYSANYKVVDEYYVDFFNLELLAGRNIRPSDSLKRIVVNEQVLKFIGISSPQDAIGKSIQSGWGGEKEIVGVVKDFHVQSLHSDLEPVVLLYYPPGFFAIDIKLDASAPSLAGMENTISEIDKVWLEVYPEAIFDYTFLEDDISAAYQSERNLSKLFTIFAGMAVFIGALGLFGLISFVANQRVKEIGVRKVLGASVGQIMYIFGKETVLLLGIAFVISAPVAFWLMNDWLQNFVYRMDFNLLILVTGFGFTLVIALISTGYRALRAASSNPVDSLRSE
ncbi:FtsX-like permease family protein [uncultured Imperialibacter sp.]|uniref:FtsX-like permease family protein n=1 Tax=uncultured Imperialibacter sp. TaxID=1672639 RepID=UPI0030D753AB